MGQVAGPADEARDDSRAAGRGDVLNDPERIAALVMTGLTAAADPEMDAVAERVRHWLGVPVALVSLVEPERQVFPGMSGLDEPWAGARCTPLSHSFCRHVVATAEPLVIADARVDPLVAASPAITDLGVIAYVGMPLTDRDGHVLGSLCAIDTEPHDWTEGEIAALRDLAWGCSTVLRLRLAEYDAARERARRDELDALLSRSYARSQLLLRASQAFTDTVSTQDIRQRVGSLAETSLAPAYVGLAVLGADDRLHRLVGSAVPEIDADEAWDHYRVQGSDLPTAVAVRENRILAYRDRASLDAAHPTASPRAQMRASHLHALVVAPLPGPSGPIGALTLGWDRPHQADPVELLSIATIAGYAAQALIRAQRLESRTSVVHELQQAMLTELPTVPGLSWAVRYRPADARENVGGDWYDAVVLPGDEEQGGDGVGSVMVSVGDIIGHNVTASTIMGQTRSMLRQATWDRPGIGPSELLTAFDTAAAGVGLSAAGSALLAQLRPTPSDGWLMRWTNAGHPTPVLLDPDGTTRLLDGHDAMFGFNELRHAPRHDHEISLERGATLLLYTDGLVERRHYDIDAGIADLRAQLAASAGVSPPDLVDSLVDLLGAQATDDVVVFAIRVL